MLAPAKFGHYLLSCCNSMGCLGAENRHTMRSAGLFAHAYYTSSRFSYKLLTLGIAASLLLTACGDDDDNDSDPLPPAKVGVQALNTGDLLSTPTTVNNLSANQLMTALETIDPAAATVAGTPKCGARCFACIGHVSGKPQWQCCPRRYCSC